MRDQGRQINDVAERVTRAEESSKSAHLRITEVSKLIEDLQNKK